MTIDINIRCQFAPQRILTVWIQLKSKEQTALRNVMV